MSDPSARSTLDTLSKKWRELAGSTMVDAAEATAMTLCANDLDAALASLAPSIQTAKSVDDALDVYVPGAWKCLKCDFHLQKQTIFMQSGTIGSSRDDVLNLTGEVCPNDGEPMARETWHERSEANYQWGVKQLEREEALKRRMEELYVGANDGNSGAGMRYVIDKLREVLAGSLDGPEAPPTPGQPT